VSLVCAERLDPALNIVMGAVNARRLIGLELEDDVVSEAEPLEMCQRYANAAVAL